MAARRPDPPEALLELGPEPTLPALAEAAQRCTACPLHRDATQAVFGEGPPGARLLLVGEQPGDHEDLEGHPFVGPAGRLLDRALADAGIAREDAYLTNAVKHFKWKRAGKVRLHQTPAAGEVAACRPWLLAELARVQPEVVVALGATAGKALVGASFRVTRDRGTWLPSEGLPLAPDARVTATVHPSAVLRAPDRDAAYASLVADLRGVAAAL